MAPYAIVSDLCRDALREIGAIGATDAGEAPDMQLALTRFQGQVDAWGAERLTLALQTRTQITWPSNTATQTIGPGGNIVAARPAWINHLNYVNPSTSGSNAVEVAIGQMDQDSFAVQSIKGLLSALPQNFFYQTSVDTSGLGTIQLWPVPNQNLTLYLYAPLAVGVPVTLNDTISGPPGYQEAFLYQLAVRLYTPFWGPQAQPPPLLVQNATESFLRMKRPNNDPGLLGVDPALVPSTGGAYNILTDTYSGFSR